MAVFEEFLFFPRRNKFHILYLPLPKASWFNIFVAGIHSYRSLYLDWSKNKKISHVRKKRVGGGRGAEKRRGVKKFYSFHVHLHEETWSVFQCDLLSAGDLACVRFAAWGEFSCSQRLSTFYNLNEIKHLASFYGVGGELGREGKQ